MTTMTITTSTYGAEIVAHFDTPEAAQTFAQQFPKSTKLAGTVNSHSLVGPGGTETGIVKVFVKLLADGVNGGTNEAGLKRLATVRRSAVKLGVKIIEKSL